MVNIPENNAQDLIAAQQAAHDKELECITNQFLDKLKDCTEATISCEEHMIGYHGSNAYHHLCDTIEVAKQFSRKGYYCYYYSYSNSYGVNQRAVCIRKAPMLEGNRSYGNKVWYKI